MFGCRYVTASGDLPPQTPQHLPFTPKQPVPLLLNPLLNDGQAPQIPFLLHFLLPRPHLPVFLHQRATPAEEVPPGVIQEPGSGVQALKPSVLLRRGVATAGQSNLILAARPLVDVQPLPQFVTLEQAEDAFGAREEGSCQAVAQTRGGADWSRGVGGVQTVAGLAVGNAGAAKCFRTRSGIGKAVEETNSPGLALCARDIGLCLASSVGHTRAGQVGVDIAVTHDFVRAGGFGVGRRSFGGDLYILLHQERGALVIRRGSGDRHCI